MYSLERSQRIPAPLSEVFRFFSDPRNLARLTPGALGFRIVSAPDALREGSRIEYRIRWGLFRLRWLTRITHWSPPGGFRDEQERGPYRTWIHTHSFEPDPGGTVMRDRVDYLLPFGGLGRVTHRLVVRKQLERIFDFRRTAVEQIFGSPPPGSGGHNDDGGPPD